VPHTLPTELAQTVVTIQRKQIEKWLCDLRDPGHCRDVRLVRDTFMSLAALLARLFDIEERLAFTRFEEETGLREVGPTFALRREHREIERRMQHLSRLLSSASPAELQSQLRAFSALVSAHLCREDAAIWRVCELLLDEPACHETMRILLQGGGTTL
jgi:hypothetical protein